MLSSVRGHTPPKLGKPAHLGLLVQGSASYLPPHG